MSASREKQNRRDQASSGYVSPKTEREARQRRQERRNNMVYATIAVILAVIVAASAVWNSNIIPRTVTAVTADGRRYTPAQVSFYYHTAYASLLNAWGGSEVASSIGLNTGAALKYQTVSESTAELLNTEAGITWEEFFLERGIEYMVSVDNALAQAKQEGFVFPDSVQEEYDSTMETLAANAGAAGVSLGRYIAGVSGSGVTERLYRTELLRFLQYQSYLHAYSDSLSYTEEDLEAFYAENPDDYDLAYYESVYLYGGADATTDEDGNTVQPTEEEIAANQERAKTAADEILAAYQAGGSLSAEADSRDYAYYMNSEDTGGSSRSSLRAELGDWLFDAGRKAGDTELFEIDGNCFIMVFKDRRRDESKTVDVRHILIQPEDTDMDSEDEGYADEVARLDEEAKAKAEEVYEEWKSGEATEESFGELAAEYSADGNAADGGLYTGVYEGQMVTSFNDWIFDPARQYGDTDIVETDYGYHIMFYVGNEKPRWQEQVSEDLKEKDYTEWGESFYKDSGIQRHEFGMGFVD